MTKDRYLIHGDSCGLITRGYFETSANSPDIMVFDSYQDAVNGLITIIIRQRPSNGKVYPDAGDILKISDTGITKTRFNMANINMYKLTVNGVETIVDTSKSEDNIAVVTDRPIYRTPEGYQ